MKLMIFSLLFLSLIICFFVSGDPIDELFNEAESAYNLGNYDESIEICDQILTINANRADAWRGKGRALIEQGKYAQSLGALDKAIELNPDSPYSWYFKGNALSGLKKYDEAIIAYDKSLSILPNFSKAQKNRDSLITATRSLNGARETENLQIDGVTISPTVDNYNDEYRKGQLSPNEETDNGAPFSFLRVFFDYWYVWGIFIIIAFYLDPILGGIVLFAPFIIFLLIIAYILLVIGLSLFWVIFSHLVGINLLKGITIVFPLGIFTWSPNREDNCLKGDI